MTNQLMRREPHPYLHGELVVVIDCARLGRSAEFWTGALGRQDAPSTSSEAAQSVTAADRPAQPQAEPGDGR